jgi:hypothetical protein
MKAEKDENGLWQPVDPKKHERGAIPIHKEK